MHSIKQDQAESGFKTKPRLPVTPVILDRLQDHLLAQDDLMLWAAACTGFLASSVRGNSCAFLIRNMTLLLISPWQIMPWTALGFGSSKARPTPFEQVSMSSYKGQSDCTSSIPGQVWLVSWSSLCSCWVWISSLLGNSNLGLALSCS